MDMINENLGYSECDAREADLKKLHNLEDALLLWQTESSDRQTLLDEVTRQSLSLQSGDLDGLDYTNFSHLCENLGAEAQSLIRAHIADFRVLSADLSIYDRETGELNPQDPVIVNLQEQFSSDLESV